MKSKSIVLAIATIFLLPIGTAYPQTSCPPQCTSSDYQDGEAGYQLGKQIYNNTIGRDNPLPPDPPTYEDRARNWLRDAGKKAGGQR